MANGTMYKPFVAGNNIAITENATTLGVKLENDKWRGLDTNLFLGVLAAGDGNLTADGINNTAIGYRALQAITSSPANVAIGAGALASFSGAGPANRVNTAVGVSALTSLLTGLDSVAVGQSAGALMTSSSTDVIVGSDAMYYTTTSQGNVVVGGAAMLNADGTQTQNVVVGSYAGDYLKTGSTANVISGYEAGKGAALVLVAQNVFVGYQAGYSIATASYRNVLVGSRAGYLMTTGADNILIGYWAGYSAGVSLTTGSRNILIGKSVLTPAVGTDDYLNIGDLITGNLAAGSKEVTVTGGFNIGSAQFKRFYQEITLSTVNAITVIGLTPAAVIFSAAFRVSEQITGLDSANHSLGLGVSGGAADKYGIVLQGSAQTYIDVNKKNHSWLDSALGRENDALVLTIGNGADNIPSAGKVYVEVIYLKSVDLADV